ncbi:hypothetical protein FBFR_11175 [Flavobacterium fryxellicola]|uniref:DUF2254 domain-containing protein n=2 Tax=Flavobacterium fryxellicola TaxID=249352 RepID=A0A167WH80_9FLAO|nr:hypothetical protein FBFR_11175 [Flavobacterium fryxellicola]
MTQKLKYKIKNIFIHQLKDLGTFLGAVYALVIGSALMILEYNIDFGVLFKINIFDTYSRLIAVSNVLISILIGISLTTFSVIFVVMQLASHNFHPEFYGIF